MTTEVLSRVRENFKTRRDFAVALTAFTPIALVLGRAVADYAISIAAVLFLFDCFVRRDFKWAKQGWVIAALALWAYSVIRAMFVQAWPESLYWAFVWVRYIVFAACVAAWTLQDEKSRNWLLYASLFAIIFLAGDGLIQYFLGKDIFGHSPYGDRLTGSFKRPILGVTIANLFAAPLFWLLHQKKALTGAVLASLCLAAVFFSGDRMGLLCAAAIMLVWFVFLAREKPRQWAALAIIVVSAFSLFSFSPAMVERQVHSTAETAQNVWTSPYGLAWKSAWDVGTDHLIFGAGMRQFRVACLDEKFGPLVDPATGSQRCYTHPHNAWLEWFSEEGLVGLVGFAAFALTVGITAFRKLRAQPQDLILWGLSAYLAIRLMPLLVSTSFFNNWLAIPFWLALGWAMSYKTSVPKRSGALA